jgi:hypothetical protein
MKTFAEPIKCRGISMVLVTALFVSGSVAFAQTPNPASASDEITSRIPHGHEDDAIPPGSPSNSWEGDHPWAEVAMEVTNIIFDHTSGDSSDGMRIRWNHNVPLNHDGGTTGGEYRTDTHHNEPAAWKAGVTPKVRVRIEVRAPHGGPQDTRDDIEAGEIWAVPTGPNAADQAWLKLKPRVVEFKDGVSFNGGTGPESEYVEFELDGTVPGVFNRWEFGWKFFCKGLTTDDGQFVQVLPPWDEATVEVEFYETVTLHSYSTLNTPGSPWFGGEPENRPWVIAFVFVGDVMEAFGQTSASGVAATATTFIYEQHSLKYEHVEGATHYLASPSYWSAGDLAFTAFMHRENGHYVNCADVAAAIVISVNLASGSAAQAQVLDNYGFIPESDFIGGAEEVNNPFYESARYRPDKKVGTDDLDVMISGGPYDGMIARSRFGWHMWAKLSGAVYDATLGPHVGVAEGNYMSVARDTTTTAEETLRDVDAQGTITNTYSVGEWGSRVFVSVGLSG